VKIWCSYWSRPIWKHQIRCGRRAPEPIAGPGQAAAETYTAQDRDRPRASGDKLSYPETEQMGWGTNGTRTPDHRGNVAALIMVTPNST